MTPEESKQARGVDLLVQRQNILHQAATVTGVDSRIRAFEALNAFDEARTDEEWELMRVAQFGAGKVGLRVCARQFSGRWGAFRLETISIKTPQRWLRPWGASLNLD